MSNWDSFDTDDYLHRNYSKILPPDARIIDELVDYYRSMGSIGSSLEVGVGPNLYPTLLIKPYSKKIHLIEISEPNLKYLYQQQKSLDDVWLSYWDLLTKKAPDKYFGTLSSSDLNLEISKGSIYALPQSKFDLVSMFFVAESITKDAEKFKDACLSLVSAAKPGGRIVSLFMENSTGYHAGKYEFPAIAINLKDLEHTFSDVTLDLSIERIQDDNHTVRSGGYTGMLLLTANRL